MSGLLFAALVYTVAGVAVNATVWFNRVSIIETLARLSPAVAALLQHIAKRGDLLHGRMTLKGALPRVILWPFVLLAWFIFVRAARGAYRLNAVDGSGVNGAGQNGFVLVDPREKAREVALTRVHFALLGGAYTDERVMLRDFLSGILSTLDRYLPGTQITDGGVDDQHWKFRAPEVERRLSDFTIGMSMPDESQMSTCVEYQGLTVALAIEMHRTVDVSSDYFYGERGDDHESDRIEYLSHIALRCIVPGIGSLHVRFFREEDATVPNVSSDGQRYRWMGRNAFCTLDDQHFDVVDALRMEMLGGLNGWDVHEGHGRGDEQAGPEDSDCMCRGTPNESQCAQSGCGFCSDAQRMAQRAGPSA